MDRNEKDTRKQIHEFFENKICGLNYLHAHKNIQTLSVDIWGYSESIWIAVFQFFSNSTRYIFMKYFFPPNNIFSFRRQYILVFFLGSVELS